MSPLRSPEATPEDLADLVLKPQEFMEALGAYMVGLAQQAFSDQAWDGSPWMRRYPNQSGAPINIAGVIADFAAGKTEPAGRRFDDRPVGMDTGALRASITASAPEIRGPNWSVDVGSDLPYADRFHGGGENTQQITPFMRRAMGRWLKRHPEYRDKLGPILNRNTHEWTTESPARPFLGITPGIEAKLAKFVEEFIGGMS